MSDNQRGRRVVVETRTPRRPTSRSYHRRQPREVTVALSVIGAAVLATFVALFITSRPYDPMNSTIAPQGTVPSGLIVQSSPKPSPTTMPSPQEKETASPQQASVPAGETANTETPDDTTIQAEIEKTIDSDARLSKLDVSTIVEGGKVTLVGSVGSAELRGRVEKVVRSVKGVVAVNNQLTVAEATP